MENKLPISIQCRTYRSGVVEGVLEEPEVKSSVVGEELRIGRQGEEAIAQLGIARISGRYVQIEEARARLQILGRVILLAALAAVVQAVHKLAQSLAAEHVAAATRHVGLRKRE